MPLHAASLLIEGIAWHLEHPAARLSTETPAVRTAMELGKIRHAQGYTADDILAEYELLGRILFDELCVLAEEAHAQRPRAFLKGGMLLFHAIAAIERSSTAHYLALAKARVVEREERLNAFNRAVSHEIKNRIGTIVSAGQLLAAREALSRARQQHFAEMVTRNAEEISATVKNLLVLARLEDAPPAYRQTRLRDVVSRVLTQCRGFAEEAGVHVEVAGDLPDIDVADEALSLALLNYVRNAIKYRNPAGEAPRAHISAKIERDGQGGEELRVCVADNGLGVPPDKREGLFRRFFRAHPDTHPGTGLGLAIAREMIEMLGGRAWAEFPEAGSVFCVAVPVHVAPGSPRSLGK
jgi:signal transduction histidine kinase